jgi:hypothetical protein
MSLAPVAETDPSIAGRYEALIRISNSIRACKDLMPHTFPQCGQFWWGCAGRLARLDTPPTVSRPQRVARLLQKSMWHYL